MALLSQDAPDLMKSRLEQGVWLDQIERSYNAWYAAPNHKKPELLLTGPTLTWAESWMLSQPKELSGSLKQYIIRSLSAGSRKSAGERADIEKEQRRKDKVYRYLLISMSIFALLVLAPGIVRDFLGYQVDHAVPMEAGPGPEGGPNFAEGGDTTGGNPSADPEPAPVEVKPKTEPKFVRLSRAVQIQGDKGNDRLTSLLAAEFFESLKAPATLKDERALRENARSAVADTFVKRTEPLRPSDRIIDQAPAIACPQSARFVGMSEAREVRVWNGAAGSTAMTAALKPQQVKAGAVDPGCGRLVTVSEDYELIVTPLARGAKGVKIGAHEADVVGIGLSGDGNRAVSVSRDQTGAIWDVRTGRRLADLRVEDTTFIGASMSLDGARAVTWSEEQTAHVWDAATGRLLGSLKGHQGPIVKGEFSDDGRRVLTRSIDGTAILWDVTAMRALNLIKAESGSVLDARMSKDGRYVAVINEAAAVQVFDSALDAPISELSSGKGKIRGFTFSDNGKLIATLDWSGGISVWSAESGERLAELNRRADPIATVMFSPNGSHLSALTQSGAVSEWTLVFDEAQLHNRITAAGYACFSAEEARQFDIDPSASRPWCLPAVNPPQPAAQPVLAPAEKPSDARPAVE